MVLNRGGAEEARGAHNSEVIGSNPISGTQFIYSSSLCMDNFQDIAIEDIEDIEENPLNSAAEYSGS